MLLQSTWKQYPFCWIQKKIKKILSKLVFNFDLFALVCLCGFGNIRGRIEVWNIGTKNVVPEQVCSIAADDTTYFEWCPDGEHILTATTSPRLRVSNG
jgi:uncharacterized protein with WD repeat